MEDGRGICRNEEKPSNITGIRGKRVISTERPKVVDEEFIARYRNVFPLADEISFQDRYESKGNKAPFLPVDPINRDVRVRVHFDRSIDGWVGSRAPIVEGKPATSFLLLDFDADESPATQAIAWSRVVAFREALDPHVVQPLAFRSPGGGYHVIYFLDSTVPLHELVNIHHAQSQGLLHAIARAVLGTTGAGRFEVFPGPRQLVRWPLGRRQYLVDQEAGQNIAEDDPHVLLDIVEDHWRKHRVSLAHLRSVHQRLVPERAKRNKKKAVLVGVTEDVPESTIRRAQLAYSQGLSGFGTRHDTMRLLARVMVHDPDALVEHGYDLKRPPAEQLHEWLHAKNNGLSRTYNANSNPEFWRKACDEYIDAAWGGSHPGIIDKGLLRLSEWDQVFRLDLSLLDEAPPRHRIELVYAALLLKVGSIVLFTGREREPDGTYTVQVHSSWWRELPFCSDSTSLKHYRNALLAAGAFSRGRKYSADAGRAQEYAGFHVVLYGPYPRSSLNDQELKRLSTATDPNDWIRFHYCDEALRRFPGAALTDRYGSGAQWIQKEHKKLLKRAGIEGTISRLTDVALVVEAPPPPRPGQQLTPRPPRYGAYDDWSVFPRRFEWERIFDLRVPIRRPDMKLHVLEMFATYWVLKARKIVSDGDLQAWKPGCFWVPIPSDWRRTIPGFSDAKKEKLHLNSLMAHGIILNKMRQRIDEQRWKVTEYEFPLDFGPSPFFGEFQYEALELLDYMGGREGPLFRYVSAVYGSFDEAERERRYGAEGVAWFERHHQRMVEMLEKAESVLKGLRLSAGSPVRPPLRRSSEHSMLVRLGSIGR